VHAQPVAGCRQLDWQVDNRSVVEQVALSPRSISIALAPTMRHSKSPPGCIEAKV
jgi:hypothetical protein